MVIDGLRTGKGPKLDITTGGEAGRGVVAGEAIEKGAFICEYKTSKVFPVKKREEVEARHELNGLGCYIVETKHSVPGFGHLCFDATERFHHPGRYLNHVSKGPNSRLTRPFEVRGKVRIGFLALRDIPEGEEICYDYGDRSGGEWMRKGRLEEGRVVAGETVGEAVAAVAKQKKKPHRNLYYCPLPECADRACLERIANHIHQYHDLHGEEARRVLKKKVRATKEQEKEKKRRQRIEKGSGDIRDMFDRPSRARKCIITDTTVGKRQGKAKGKSVGKSTGMGKGKEKGKDMGKGKGKAGSGSKGERSGLEAREGEDHDTASSRPGTREMCQHTGPFLDSFSEFLMSRVGGKKSPRNAKGIVVNVSKYLYWCDPSSLDISHLTMARKIREYIEGLEGHVGPSGLQQHTSDIENALRFCVHVREGADDELDFIARAESTFRKLKYFRASFRGEKSKKERARLEDLAEHLPDTSDTVTFLESASLTQVFEQCCSNLLKDPSLHDYNKAVTICAGRLLYRNAQRPGAIVNMTLKEYDNAIVHGEGEGEVLMIRVAKHKTGLTERASVNCSGKLRDQLKLFIDARRHLIRESDLVFAKWLGLGPVMDLTARVVALGEKLNLQLLTAQKLRSVVEIKATPLDSSTKSLVARALSHSELTAEHHYRAAQPSGRAKAYQAVGELVGLPTVDPIPATRKRTRFTAKQTEIIMSAFAEEIATKRPPNKATADKFILDHQEEFAGKSSKDIYDKVRNQYRNK